MQIQEEGSDPTSPVSPTSASSRVRTGSYKASLQPVGRQASSEQSNPTLQQSSSAPSSGLSGKVVASTVLLKSAASLVGC